MTLALLGFAGSILTACSGVWKLFSDDEAAANTPGLKAAAEARQQADFEQRATQAHAEGELKTIRDLEAE